MCSQEVSLYEALTGFRSAVRHLDGRTVHMACEGEVTRLAQERDSDAWETPQENRPGGGPSQDVVGGAEARAAACFPWIPCGTRCVLPFLFSFFFVA